HIEGLPLSAMWHQGNNTIYLRSLLEILSDNIDELTRDL
ncbi:LysR family transcriptional regulator, partial [Acinetobacter baumannii]|nr:LysR family transcriptional regulator [Acinetobacter baumannii]